VKGKTKVGYETKILIEILEEFLGYHILRKAFIVGVGNLGVALIKYHEFNNEGMEIITGFDIDSDKLKTQINHLKLFHVDKFKENFEKTPVDIGIITLPADQAQKTADLMIECGIRAIWNFSATPLSAPDNVIVENTSIDSGLAMIKWKLHQNKPLIYKNRIL
jgi:redox-sensing transcriptional repressor